ncbi:MAG: hypothetical protein IT310_07975 [Anaerolineales bacterium]|nr:hypothetical protein [Anaerolineales bacterium]
MRRIYLMVGKRAQTNLPTGRGLEMMMMALREETVHVGRQYINGLGIWQGGK